MLMVDHVDESGKITQMNFKQRHNSTSDQGEDESELQLSQKNV